jgi:hypothetical protein
MFRYIWVGPRMRRTFSPTEILTETKNNWSMLDPSKKKVQVCPGDAGQTMRVKKAGISCRSLSLIVPNTIRRMEISAQGPKVQNTRSTFLLCTRIRPNLLESSVMSQRETLHHQCTRYLDVNLASSPVNRLSVALPTPLSTPRRLGHGSLPLLVRQPTSSSFSAVPPLG